MTIIYFILLLWPIRTFQCSMFLHVPRRFSVRKVSWQVSGPHHKNLLLEHITLPDQRHIKAYSCNDAGCQTQFVCVNGHILGTNSKFCTLLFCSQSQPNILLWCPVKERMQFYASRKFGFILSLLHSPWLLLKMSLFNKFTII